MATAIFFNGRRLNVPQAVSKVDASALAAVSPAAVGVIAFVGMAEGGAPLSVKESDSDATQPGTVQERYRSGDLRTAGIFAFEPSQDELVPGGASKEILVKVNPATQAGTSLPDDNGADSLDITSKDWGLFTEQVNLEVTAGTLDGKLYTVVFEGNSESFDNVGGEAIMDVLYDPGAEGYDTMVGSIDATSFLAAATKAMLGMDDEIDGTLPSPPEVIAVASNNVADTTQTVTVYGLDAVGDPVSESFALQGTTVVVGTVVFQEVLGARVDAVCVGNIAVTDSLPFAQPITIPAGTLTRGLLDLTNTPAAGVATVSIDVDTAVDVILYGTNSAGAQIAEAFDMTAGATTPVVGTTSFASLSFAVLGEVPIARTVSVSIDSARTLHSTFTTIAKVVDRLNTLAGFTANALVSNFTSFLMADADYHAAPARPAVSLIGAAGDFFADLYFAAKTLTEQSQYVNAARAPGGGLPPADTVAPVFLVGGSEGTTTITEWQAAFKLLEKRRYNILVPLSRDPAVHSLALTHLLAKAGRLKSEANGYVGIGKADGSGETRSELQAQIQALNTRHLAAIAQEVERFDPLTGEATWYPPYMFAAIAAGMQAGSAIAEPLTRKIMIATDIRNDPTWDVDDDRSDLIDRGLMMAEKVDGVGIRWIRSITTHLADDNLAFTEVSSNESLITFLFEFRTALDKKIGNRGLPGTVGQIKSLASGVADRLVDEEKIFAHRALQIEQIGDVFPVSIEVALINPVNFIPITVHLAPSVASA